MNRMPTRPDAVAKGPTEAGALPSELVSFGRQQWCRRWRVFAGQFTQPQMMKLAFAVLGEQAIHSSQIHGFSTGKLRDPAPKVLLCIGLLNLAIARSNGCEEAGDGPKCPGSLSELWKDKRWLVDEKGLPMGPIEVLMAITGQIDLETDSQIQIDPEDQAAVSKSLGKYVRTKLMELGIDFMDGEEMAELNKACPIAEELIFGKEVDAVLLADHLPDIAEICSAAVDEVVDFAISPITRK